MMTDAQVLQFLQDWLLQIVTAFSVFYLIRLSKTRRKTERLTEIKVDAMAYALGKTSIGQDFIKEYDAEVQKKIGESKYKDGD
jgi:maleate cis-trans isomerase